MKKIGYYLTSATLFALPMVVGAQATIDSGGVLKGFLNSVLTFINNALIPFILGVGFLLFVWGMFQYFIAGGADDEAKTKGKSLMLYATLGFVLIIIFWGVVNLVANGTGLKQNFDAGLIPTLPTTR
jgi:hypothetical protein